MSLMIHKKLIAAIKQHNLFTERDTLVVAVSGGADSVALLDLLATLPGFSLNLIAVHLNHMLRGAESDQDEDFVAGISSLYNIPCKIKKIDVAALAIEKKTSIEEAGREARYLFFEEMRQQFQAAGTAVAHHLDDQAETFLLRLLRGAGVTGLSGMPFSSDRRVIRPLLGITRSELQEYITFRGLSFREDASNSDLTFLRNRIRHELLPLLESYSSGISRRLSASSQLIGDEDTLMRQYATRLFESCSLAGSGFNAILADRLREQPSAMRLRLYRLAIEKTNDSLRRFYQNHFMLIDAFLHDGKTGSRIEMPSGIVVFLTARYLVFARHETLEYKQPESSVISGCGVYDLGNGLRIIVEKSKVPASWSGLPASITFIDVEQAPFPWLIKPASSSDRLQLPGMSGRCSVKSILSDAGFPRHLRQVVPLIFHREHPLWLAGVRRTSHAMLSPEHQYGIKAELTGLEKMNPF